MMRRQSPFGLLDNSYFDEVDKSKPIQATSPQPVERNSRRSIVQRKANNAETLRSSAPETSTVVLTESSRPQSANPMALPAARPQSASVSRRHLSSSSRPQSAGNISRPSKQLVQEVMQEQALRTISASLTSQPKISFPFLKRGANNNCTTFSYMMSVPAEEEDEQKERLQEGNARLKTLVAEKKKRRAAESSSFSSQLYHEMFQFYERILLTIQEANDMCRELRKSNVYELVLLSFGDVDVSAMPRELADLSNPLHLNPSNPAHMHFLTQVFLRTDQLIQIQKRTNVVSVPSSFASNPVIVRTATSKALSLVWRLFLKEHELLQRQYRQFKILHPEQLDLPELEKAYKSMPIPAASKAANLNEALNQLDEEPNEPEQARHMESSRGIGGLMLSAVRNFGNHVDLSNDVASSSSGAGATPQPRQVTFNQPVEEHKTIDIGAIVRVKHVAKHIKAVATKPTAEVEGDLVVPPIPSKTAYEIQIILDTILSDMQGKKDVVEEQIASIERKGWNQFAHL